MAVCEAQAAGSLQSRGMGSKLHLPRFIGSYSGSSHKKLATHKKPSPLIRLDGGFHCQTKCPGQASMTKLRVAKQVYDEAHSVVHECEKEWRDKSMTD